MSADAGEGEARGETTGLPITHSFPRHRTNEKNTAPGNFDFIHKLPGDPRLPAHQTRHPRPIDALAEKMYGSFTSSNAN